jgi:hypothetical protein
LSGKRVRAAAWLAAAAIPAAVASSQAVGASPPAAACGKLLPPASGAYFGAFTDFNVPGEFSEDHVAVAKINAFERLAGRNIVWAYFAQHWYKGLQFPREKVLAVWRNGQVPYIVFQPDSGALYGPGRRQQFPEERFSLQRIVDGRFDPQLRAWADAARATAIPILLEFGTEVNDDWGPWNGRWNGAGQVDGYGDPTYPDGAERFRDTYRHLVTLFREEGATNVTWFFHADSYPQDDWWNRLEWYYPGDEYVDWVGISDYGSLAADQPIVGFFDKLASSGVYDDLAALSKRPLAIVELGVVDDAQHEKPAWIREAFNTLRTRTFLRLRAAVWWQTNSPPNDTRVDSSPDALQAFRAGIAGPFFGAKPRFGGDCLPAVPVGVSASGGVFAGKVRVTWQPSLSATGYEIWRSSTRRGARILIGTTGGLAFADRRASPARTYYYAVRALNPLGRGAFGPAVAGFRR